MLAALLILWGVSAPDLRRVLHAQGYYDADLSVELIELLRPAIAGEPLETIVQVSNRATNPANDVVVVSSLPSDVAFGGTVGCSGDPSGFPLCALGELSPGEDRQFELHSRIASDAFGSFSLTFVATSSTGDADPSNDVLSIDVEVSREADFSVFLDNGTSFFEQAQIQQVEYLMTVRNGGPSDGGQASVEFQGPVAFTPENWVCFSDPGVDCAPTGTGAPLELIDADREGEALFVISGTLNPDVEGTLVAQGAVTGAIDAVDRKPLNNVALDIDSVGMFGDGFEVEDRVPVSTLVDAGTWLQTDEPASAAGHDPLQSGMAGRVVDLQGRTLALILERRDSMGVLLQLAAVSRDSGRLLERSEWIRADNTGFRVTWDRGVVLEVGVSGGRNRFLRSASEEAALPIRFIRSSRWRPATGGR